MTPEPRPRTWRPPFDAARGGRPRQIHDIAAPVKAVAPELDGDLPQPSLTGPPPPVPPARKPRGWFWRQYRVFLSVMLGALLLIGAAVGLWYGLPIRTVEVSGNKQLTLLEVKRLAGLSNAEPFGWLYYGAWLAQALADNAWVESAHITRVFPGRIEVRLQERVPVAQLRDRSGVISVVAADGTPLPGAQATGPVISGWGPDRMSESLFAARALARYNVQSVTYTPTGLTVHTSQGTIWSGNSALLLKYAKAIETQAQGGRINLYPWGVSVQR